MGRVLIAGCGYIGSALGKVLADNGHYIAGLKRHINTDMNEIHYFKADLTRSSDLVNLDTSFDQVLFMAAPGGKDEESYRHLFETGLDNFLNIFSQKSPKTTFIFVSSTNVYGQDRGEYIDEDSLTNPNNFKGNILLSSENNVLSQNSNNTIVRFSAIYGPGRNRMIKMALTSPEIQQDPPFYINQIHKDDCVGILKLLVEKKMAGEKLKSTILASDDDPAPMWDVVSWLALQLNSERPKIKTVSKNATQNKRCVNSYLKEIGYESKYPSYKDGYPSLISERNNV